MPLIREEQLPLKNMADRVLFVDGYLDGDGSPDLRLIAASLVVLAEEIRRGSNRVGSAVMES